MANEIEITYCTEDAYPPIGKTPPTFREVGVDRLLNRRVLDWSSKGTYGMGGPGFFGILLEGNTFYPKEWLILSLWGSASWLLLDGKELRLQVSDGKMPCEPLFATLSWLLGRLSILLLPFFALYQFSRRLARSQWDGVWRALLGSTIVGVEISETSSVLKLEKRSQSYVLETPRHGPEVAHGNRRRIKANHLDAWVISRSGRLCC
jgi:hypothetical protein